jgi:hypothetical protein
MTLRRIFTLYMKSRLQSWLNESDVCVYTNGPGDSQITLAHFRNGRRVRPQKPPEAQVPDYPPPNWNQN